MAILNKNIFSTPENLQQVVSKSWELKGSTEILDYNILGDTLELSMGGDQRGYFFLSPYILNDLGIKKVVIKEVLFKNKGTFIIYTSDISSIDWYNVSSEKVLLRSSSLPHGKSIIMDNIWYNPTVFSYDDTLNINKSGDFNINHSFFSNLKYHLQAVTGNIQWGDRGGFYGNIWFPNLDTLNKLPYNPKFLQALQSNLPYKMSDISIALYVNDKNYYLKFHW